METNIEQTTIDLKETQIIKLIIKYLTKFPIVIKDGLWLIRDNSKHETIGEISIVEGNTIDVLANLITKGKLITWIFVKDLSFKSSLFHADDSANSTIELLKEGDVIEYTWKMTVIEGKPRLPEAPKIESLDYLIILKDYNGFLHAAEMAGFVENPSELAMTLFPQKDEHSIE